MIEAAFEHGKDQWKMNVEVNQDFDMDSKALKIVSDYITECILDLRNLIYLHPDKSDPPVKFSVYTVWKTNVLQNWKYCISSTLYDDTYYELTYNGDKKEWYLDAYKKFESKVIKDDD